MDEKISQLNSLTTADQSDVYAIVDTSATETKKISQQNLEITIANSTTFIDELTDNSTFITNINTIAPSPLTTKGDIFSHNGTSAVRVPIGTSGQIPVVDSTESAGWKWADIATGSGTGGTKLAIDTTESTVTGTVTPTAVFTIPIPAETLNTNDAIRYKMTGSYTSGGLGSATIDITYGGQSVGSIIQETVANGNLELEGIIIADNSISAQKYGAHLLVDSAEVDVVKGNTTVSSGTLQNLVVTITLGATGSSFTAESIVIEKVNDGGNNKKVGVGGISDVEWFNAQFPFMAPGATTSNFNIWNMANTSNAESASHLIFAAQESVRNNGTDYSALLPDFDNSNNRYQFNSTKQAIFQVMVRGNNAGANNYFSGVGFAEFGVNTWGSSESSTSVRGVGFVRKDSNGQWYARVCDGSAMTQTAVTISDAKHVLRCEYDPGNATPAARFYIDGVLVATITTNLPTAQSQIVGFFGGNGVDATSIGITAISCPAFAVEI